VLAVETMGYVFLLTVQVVEHYVCVGGSRCCENYYFCELRQLLQELHTVGPNPHSCLPNITLTARVPPL